MSFNRVQLGRDNKNVAKATNARKQLSSNARRNNEQELKSQMGYRDGSYYRNQPYLDINTPTGIIDMSDTGIPIYANGILLEPYSGMHQFKPGIVREIPAYQNSGQTEYDVMELTDEEIEEYRKLGYRIEEMQ